jgi:hypothetical protein
VGDTTADAEQAGQAGACGHGRDERGTDAAGDHVTDDVHRIFLSDDLLACGSCLPGSLSGPVTHDIRVRHRPAADPPPIHHVSTIHGHRHGRQPAARAPHRSRSSRPSALASEATYDEQP